MPKTIITKIRNSDGTETVETVTLPRLPEKEVTE